MSMPSTDYSQQILAYLEVWREILEQSTTAAAGLAPMLPTGTPFMPPMPTGMPGTPPMPPTGPVVPPAPADYAQQLFRYLQAWRQYLEQMTGAMPGSAQPPTAHQGGNQYPPTPPTPPGNPPLIDKPPAYRDESAEPSSVVGPVSNSNLSLPPNDQGASASLYSKGRADGSGIWPPNNNVLVRPATEGGTMVPINYQNKIDPGDVIETPTGPVTDSRGGPAASHVLRPPIYDWGNQWVPALRGADVRRAAVTPDTRAQRIPDTPARRAPSQAEAQVSVDVASSHRAAMDRVTLDATPKVEIKSNFREPGQAR